jgi:hypothetical protein
MQQLCPHRHRPPKQARKVGVDSHAGLEFLTNQTPTQPQHAQEVTHMQGWSF